MDDSMSETIRGVAALMQMLECIGGMDDTGESLTDHDVARIMCRDELALRALVRFALGQLVKDGS